MKTINADIFSQISDTTGIMEWTKFVDYLREALALPTAVFEGPTFGYTDLAAKSCFDVRTKSARNIFIPGFHSSNRKYLLGHFIGRSKSSIVDVAAIVA